MYQVLQNASRRDDIGAIVFTGTGEQAFCAGQDLAETERFISGEHVDDWITRLKRFYDIVRATPKPVIGALNGLAAGSGFQFVLLMDIVVRAWRREAWPAGSQLRHSEHSRAMDHGAKPRTFTHDRTRAQRTDDGRRRM
jgi:enoyl-CoA hydratase/carnithine racemase